MNMAILAHIWACPISLPEYSMKFYNVVLEEVFFFVLGFLFSSTLELIIGVQYKGDFVLLTNPNSLN